MTTNMRALAAAAVAVTTLLASSAFAESGVCDPETEVCGPPGPPPQPTLPGVGGVGGDFHVSTGTIQNGDNVQGTYSNGTYVIFGGGAPRNANPDGSVTLGTTNNTITLAPSSTPTPTLNVTAIATSAQDPVFKDFALYARGALTYGYIVDLHANTAAAAATLTSLLTQSGAIARISGAWSLTATGSSWGSISASTGVNELDPSLGGSFSSACSLINYGGTAAGCGSGSYSIPLNFVSASVYQNGNPLDFISQITLAAEANAGPVDLGYYTGTFAAMIDPKITLSSALDPNAYSLTTGAYDPNILLPPTGGVPEPAAWTLMLIGFATLGAALRGGRARVFTLAA